MNSKLYLFIFWNKILLFVDSMQVKSVKTGSVFWAACTSLSYFYMVSMNTVLRKVSHQCVLGSDSQTQHHKLFGLSLLVVRILTPNLFLF